MSGFSGVDLIFTMLKKIKGKKRKGNKRKGKKT